MLQKANEDRIREMIDAMNKFNATPEFGTTRILFTKPELENREFVKAEMRKRGFDVTEDAIGNIFAVLKGSDSSLAPVWTGSHIDTVPNAGKFDGMAGVVCGLEALQIIKESGAVHKRDITVVVYTSEEPTRYALSCIGSRTMSGDLDLEGTKRLVDQSGRTLYDKLTELQYDITKFGDIRRYKGDVYATIELHIEQNNRLEKAGVPIGIVKKICAPTNYTVEVTGCQSHAGGTDMEERQDAYAASCEMALLLERLAQECESEFNTATIGYVRVIPNAVNVIPGKVVFTIDIRDCNMDTKEALIDKLLIGLEGIANKRGVAIDITKDNHDTPLTCNNKIMEYLEESCNQLGLPYEYMISGPYHDSLFVGRFAPTAMIFVPSKNGISHSPEEWTEYKELALGTEVLANSLIKLANSEEDIEAR